MPAAFSRTVSIGTLVLSCACASTRPEPEPDPSVPTLVAKGPTTFGKEMGFLLSVPAGCDEFPNQLHVWYLLAPDQPRRLAESMLESLAPAHPRN